MGARLLDRLAYRRLHFWVDALARRGLHLEVERKPAHTILHLRGRLDSQSASVMKASIQEILPADTRYIDVDLRGVERVDGVGLAALVWTWHLVRECGGELRLIHLTPQIREIVMRMRLHQLLKIVEDREEQPMAG